MMRQHKHTLFTGVGYGSESIDTGGNQTTGAGDGQILSQKVLIKPWASLLQTLIQILFFTVIWSRKRKLHLQYWGLILKV